MAYAADLKSAAREGVRVRVPEGPHRNPSSRTQRSTGAEALVVAHAGASRTSDNVASGRKTRNSAPMPPGRMPPVHVITLIALGSCTVFAPQTRVTILHTTSADRAIREEGKSLSLDHWQIETAPPGLEKGFFVVKSDLEWHQRWPTVDAEKVPVLPPDFSFAREMLFVVAPPDRDLVGAELRTAVVNEGAIHAYIEETFPGVDCPAPDKDGKPSYDIVRVPLVDGKDVQFHIETSPGDSCGSAPEAKITCRADAPAGASPDAKPAFVESLAVDPGTKVSCIVGSFTSPRPVIDLTWTFAALPIGSTSKMVVGPRGTSVSFTPDVFGAYGLQVEVLDDLQRRGASLAEVNATPRAPFALQLVWTKFDPEDDPSTFPRIELAVQPLSADGAPLGSAPAAPATKGVVPLPGAPGAPPIAWRKSGVCSIESASPYCKAEPMGFTTVASIDPQAAKLFAVGVHFTDERVEGQAVPCVRSYRIGKLVSDVCDTIPRRADSWWQAVVLDAETGKTVQAVAAERSQAAAKVAADAKAAPSADAKGSAKPGSSAPKAEPPATPSGVLAKPNGPPSAAPSPSAQQRP